MNSKNFLVKSVSAATVPLNPSEVKTSIELSSLLHAQANSLTSAVAPLWRELLTA